MKYLLIILLPVFSFSQKELALNLNFCHSGRTLDLIYNFKVNKNYKVGVGLLYNLTDLALIEKNNSYIFKKKLVPSSWNEYFGIHGYSQYYLDIPKLKIKSFIFTDLQLKYSKTLNYTYEGFNNRFGPFVWIQKTIGFGIDVPLTNQLLLNQKLAWGAEFILGSDKSLPLTYSKFSYEFATMYNVGLIYQFKQKEKSLQ